MAGGAGTPASVRPGHAPLAPSVRALDVPVEELTVEQHGRFDIVLFLGVLYHLRHPLEALEHVARLAADTLIVETRMTMRYVGKPVMQFHPGRTLENDPTNWWTPNRRCVEEMLRDIGFRHTASPSRTGVAGGVCFTRAVRTYVRILSVVGAV